MRAFPISAMLAVTAVSAVAQWIEYPTPNIPRKANGEPDLTAPAPRDAAGHPDLSGLWVNLETLPCPPLMRDKDGSCIEMMGLPKQAPNVGVDIEGGLPLSDWGRQTLAQRNVSFDPHVSCLPSNPPRMYTLPHYTKFIQVPGVLVMLNEFNASYRQIFTDGRPLPEDPQPSWNGYSAGAWDGDTLVIQSNGFRDDLWLDMRGSPMTNAARMTERFRRPNFGALEIDLTIDDPKAYTKPWTIALKLSLVVDQELIDEFCLEGERSVEHMPAPPAVTPPSAR